MMQWLKRLLRRRKPERRELAVSYGLLEFECELKNEITDLTDFEALTYRRLGTFSAVLTRHFTPGEPYMTLHFPSKTT